MSYNNSKSNYETNDVWNMAQNFLNRLDKRCDERDIFANTGELLSWYRSLRSIYRNIHFQIKKPGQEEQEELLESLFRKALTYFKNASKGDESVYTGSISLIEETLDKIDTLLNDLMFDYGLIMPKARARNMEAEIEEGWFDD